MKKAQRTLENKLSGLSRTVIYIHPNGEHTDLFQFAKQITEPDQFIYFVEGVGMDKDTYRTLNLYREQLVEQKLIVVFWLTENEARELPRLAPDFWAFRHRVLEFAPSRGSVKKALPSGILIWQAENPFLFYEPVDEKIPFQEELLASLPTSDEAVVLRSEALYSLAGYYWLKGDTQKADELLHTGLTALAKFPLPDLLALFKNGLAILAYDQKQYAAAAEALDEATRLNPENRILWANAGLVQYALGKSGKALQSIQKAFKVTAPSSGLWYILGHVYLSMGKVEMAQSSFQETLNVNAGNTFAKYGVSICYRQINDVEEQKRCIHNLVDPQTPASTYHSICMNGLLGNETAALNDLRSALTDGTLSPVFLKRDPILNAIFNDTTIQSLV